MVRRLLPPVQKQVVGPFLFFDHFGSVKTELGRSHDVRPDPHIGLALAHELALYSIDKEITLMASWLQLTP